MRIFYSWQSDLPNPSNWSLIEDALGEAAKLLSADSQIEIAPTVDRDTLDRAGAVAIADCVFGKIAEADVFVCDVSIIGEADGRKIPNPNVLTELGYAVGVLGWERVLLVCNLHFGDVEVLPFDFRGRSCLKYTNDPGSSDRATARKGLAKLLLSNLKTIAAHAGAGRLPPTRLDLEGQANALGGAWKARKLTKAENLKAINAALGWDSPDLAADAKMVNAFGTTLCHLPRRPCELYCLIVEVAGRTGFSGHSLFCDPEVLWTAVTEAAEHDANELYRWLAVLEQHGLVSHWFDEERRELIVEIKKVGGCELIPELYAFAQKVGIPLSKFLCELDFSGLDEPAT
jgi:hypothetical protein